MPNSVVLPILHLHPEDYVMAKGDSAASQHYWRQEDIECLHDIKKYTGPTVKLPNNETITSTSQGNLAISNKLSSAARTANIFPKLTSASLISVG